MSNEDILKPSYGDPQAFESPKKKEATEKIRALVEKYAFVREPGTVMMHLKGKLSAFMAAKIEQDIEGRFKDLKIEELDILMSALADELQALAEANAKKKEEDEAAEKARLEAEKTALKEKKQKSREERRAEKRKGEK